MTTTVLPGRRSRVPYRFLSLAFGATAAVLALAVLASTWSRDGGATTNLSAAQLSAVAEHEQIIAQAFAATNSGPSVAEQVAQAIAAHNAAFPLPPSLGNAFPLMSAEEAMAQHGALIDASLSAGH